MDVDKTSQRILGVAAKLFAEKGFDGTSVKDICDAANANISAISYHFGGKDELYAVIIAQFSETHLQSARSILQTPSNIEELKIRLQLFLSEFIESLISNPDVLQIVQREIELLQPRTEIHFKDALMRMFGSLVDFLKESQQKKLIKEDIDPFFAAGILFSQISHATRMDRVNKKYYGDSLTDLEYRKKWINQTLQIILGGIENQ